MAIKNYYKTNLEQHSYLLNFYINYKYHRFIIKNNLDYH